MSTSRSGDAGYLAAKDLAEIAATLEVDYRLVGGNSVSLLVAASGAASTVPGRETADADFGAAFEVIGDPRLPAALIARGYDQFGGNQFLRIVEDSSGRLELAVDLLVPSFSGQLETNQEYGGLSVDAIPGLAVALARPAVEVEVEALLTNGATLHTVLALPDLPSALCLKAYAYAGRLHARDALDIWRLLEAAAGSRVDSAAWPTGATGKDAARILHRSFGSIGSQALRHVSDDRAIQTRVRALVQQIVPSMSSWD